MTLALLWRQGRVLMLIGAFLMAGCAVTRPSRADSGAIYEQLQSTEVYRTGAVVARSSEGLQLQLLPPPRLVIQEKGLAAEAAQEIMDRRGLLPTRISRVYIEGDATLAGDRPKVDVTEKVKVFSSDRDRVILSVAPELRLDLGQRLHFKSAKIRLALINVAPKAAGVSEVILEDLTTILANTDQFTILERARIDAILAEHRLALQDFVDPKTAPKMGRLLGAEAILTGTILEAEGKSVANIRVVDAERGEVILAVRKEFRPIETPPKVVRTIPENGATNVPPTLKEIVIVFDQPMSIGWNITSTPRFDPDDQSFRQNVYWRDDRTFVIKFPSGPKPNQTYSYAINEWVGTPRLPAGGFRGLGQQKSVPVQRFFFTTGP